MSNILAMSSTSVININDGQQGIQGVSVSSEKEQWYLSSSKTALSGGSWSYTEPTSIPDGKYLFGRLEFTMSDGSKQYSDAIHRSVISGLITKADDINNKITNKVWESDIDTKISSYDSSTVSQVRDRVTAVEQDLSGVHTTISSIQSAVATKADASTVTTLSNQVNTIEDTTESHTQQISNLTETVEEKADSSTVSSLQQTVTTNEQTASAFRQTVESTYATKGELNTAKSEIKQTTDGITATVATKVGNDEVISKINQSAESVQISANKIDLVGAVTFNMLDSSTQEIVTADNTELIVGTQTASTSAWTGTSTKLSSIQSGTRIMYQLPFASKSTAVTLDLTLKNGTTTGAKEVYYKSTTRVSTQYGVGNVVELVYDGTAWRVTNPYTNDNTYDRTRYNAAITAKTAITSGNLVVADSDGKYFHLKTGDPFDISYPILYAGSNIAVNATGSNNYVLIPMTLTTTQAGPYTSQLPVYIKGTLSGTIFTPISATPFVQEIPETPDSYYYLLLGRMYSETAMYLLGEHPIYMFYDGVFKSVTQIAAEAALTADTANDKASKTLGMKVNYSTFTSGNAGECYIHGYLDNQPAEVNGYVYWNGIKRTVIKGMINPNAICPYYKTIYIVLHLSSATSSTGTAYLVWYDGGWKYSVTQPTAVGGNWVWDEALDVVLGQFIPTAAEGEIIDAYLYEPPRNASHIMSTGGNAYTYSQAAVNWVSTNGPTQLNAVDMLKFWTDNALDKTTKIQGGYIATNTIEADNLATDAIMSSNYMASTDVNAPYSATGTFLDLANGNFWSPNFGMINVTPNGTSVPTGAWFNGNVTASSGKFGSDTSYWNIESVYDYNMQEHAALVGTGSPYLQTSNWQVSDTAISTRKYTSTAQYSGTVNYYKDTDSNTFYDVGMKIPTVFAKNNDSDTERYNRAFYYIRKYTGNSAPSLDSQWTYPFMVDSEGRVYATDIIITGGGSSSTYLPLSGGTISGNLTVTGTLTATASKANQLTHKLTINGQTYDGSGSDVTISTLGVQYGGTGATTFTSGQVLIGNGQNAVTTRGIRNNTVANNLGWTSAATDITLITTNTLAYWNGQYRSGSSNLEYVKLGKLGTIVTHDEDDYLPATGGIIDGSLQVTDLTAGNLIVNGSGRFVNGVIGDVTGNLTGQASDVAGAANSTNTATHVWFSNNTTETKRAYDDDFKYNPSTNTLTVGTVSGNLTGTATYATKVKDSGNNSDITFAQSKAALTTTQDFAAWNNGELRKIAPADVLTTIGAMPEDKEFHQEDIKPILSKSYSNVYVTGNSDPAGYLYFMMVKPTGGYNSLYEVTYRMSASINGISGRQTSIVHIAFMRNTYSAYYVWNQIENTSYRPIYGHPFYPVKEAGVTAGYGPIIGLRFQSAYDPITEAHSREITIDIIEYNNCTISFYDTMQLYSEITGNGTTNFESRVLFDGITQGMTMSGDRNDTNRLYHNNTRFVAGTSGVKQYSIFMEDENGNRQSFTTNNGTGTSKTKNTTGYKLGQLFYFYSSSNIAAGATFGSSYSFMAGVDFRYSSNCGSTLVANKPVYIVGTLQNNLFYLDNTWWSQTPPTTADEKIYIFVGYAYNAYAIDFIGLGRAYYHNGTSFVRYHHNAYSATKATQDGDGNIIASTYVKKSGDTMTGKLTVPTAAIQSIVNESDGYTHRVDFGKSSFNHMDFYEYGGIYNFYKNTTASNADNAVLLGKITTNGWEGNVVGNASTATTAGSLTTARSFTVGKTAKNVKWDSAVSFTQAEISDCATNSANGWMSAADKKKLDDITVSSGGTIVASNVTGANGITVALDDTTGIATVKHANSAITAGTVSGTSNSGNVAFGSTVTIPKLTYDAYGHITKAETTTFKLPAAPTTITGNAGTATKFNSNRTISLTGDATGSASGDGSSGWSISTQVKTLRYSGRLASADIQINDTQQSKLTYCLASSSMTTNKPPAGDGYILTFGWDNSGWGTQFYLSGDGANNTHAMIRGASNRTIDDVAYRSVWGNWIYLLDEKNYTDFTVKKDGTGATGTWGIDISGNAATATEFEEEQSVTLSGDTTGSATSTAGWSLATTTGQMSATQLSEVDLNDYKTLRKIKFYYGSGGNSCTNVPIGNGLQFGMIAYPSANGYITQELSSYNGATNSSNGKWMRFWNNTSWSDWQKFLTSTNYTDYTVQKDGTGATGTWGINISGNAASLSATLPVDKGGTGATTFAAKKLLYGDGTNAIKAVTRVAVINNESRTIGSNTVYANGLKIWGMTYGNDAAQLNSGQVGVMSYGDGGPQINFIYGSSDSIPTSGQAGALIFTDNDNAGSGVSWHFVANQADWNVNSKRFVAKTSVTVGRNTPNTSYNLYVDGTSNFTDAVTGTSFAASSYIAANSGNSGTTGGLALHGTDPMNYGIAMRGTTSSIKHGYVQGDWATYISMYGNSTNVLTRGWIFRNGVNNTGVASISGSGNAVFNGSVTVGGNADNDSGMRMEYNEELGYISFIFN